MRTYHRHVTVDQPEMRLSDAERQEALDALSEHVRTGRIDLVEFDERSQKVSTAKFRKDLEALFSDLPEPQPSVLRSVRRLPPQQPHRPQPVPRASAPPMTWQQRLASSAVPIAAIVAAILFFTAARGVIFIFALPAIVALLVGSLGNRRGRRF